jgi:hypothetical protein
MHPAISLDLETGSIRFQDHAPVLSYLELLQADDFEVKHCAAKATPMAEISWTTADVLRRASDTAFALEAHRRGMCLVGAKNILSGRFANGKKPHRRKQKKNKSQRGNTQ